MTDRKILILIPPSKNIPNIPRDLVYGCWCAGKRIGGIQFPPLTSVLIATILRNHNLPVDFRDLSGEQATVEILRAGINTYAAVVMLTSTMTINEDAESLQHLKQMNPNLLTVVWGSHPTFLPEQTLNKPGIDIAVRGEGEYVIRDLMLAYSQGKDWYKLLGLAYKKNNQTIINPHYPPIIHLDELPFPDRSFLNPIVDYFNPVVERLPYTTMYTTRGCPASCTFCTVPHFYGNTIRMRSAHNVLSELKQLAEQGYKEIFFRDEIFTASKKRCMEISLGIINEKLDLSWICSARADSIDEEMIRVMKASGCHMIRIGIESGSQKILDNINKGITLETTQQLMELTHKYDIDTHAHVMIGLPGDTKETIEKTISFTKKINPAVVTFGICTPYPGTELFKQIREKHPSIEDGSSSTIDKLHRKGFFNETFCELSEKELSNYIRKAYRTFYLRPRYLFFRLTKLRNLNHLKREIKAGLKTILFAFKADTL